MENMTPSTLGEYRELCIRMVVRYDDGTGYNISFRPDQWEVYSQAINHLSNKWDVTIKNDGKAIIFLSGKNIQAAMLSEA
jgi:hypothetical protein